MLSIVLSAVSKKVVPGISTKELANIAATELKGLGGKPAFLGYLGFPDVICISVNDEVVHGIPSHTRILNEGDIVGLDFGVSYKGMLTDSAMSVIAGKPIDTKHQLLLDVTEQSLAAGINAVHDMVRVGDISNAVETYIEKRGKYGIPRELVGHGIGSNLWEEPNVPNYGKKGTGPWLSRSMTIAIEPMVTLGTHRVVTADDGWTVKTADGSWAAHFEHTVLILDEGAEILTERTL